MVRTMIPRIAHFHWTGPTMNWLRLVSIATFKKWNPDWEVRIHTTPQDIASKTDLYCQQADWTWWRMLKEHGGLQVATDIVFLRPIPEEWMESEFFGTLNGGSCVYHNAAFGSVAGGVFVSACVERCEALGQERREDTQAFGPSLLKSCEYKFGPGFFDVPMNAFCPITWDNTALFWGTEELDLTDAVGAHWYGGDESSKEHEREAGPESDHFICRLARRILEQ